jgi:hypothetical protein
MSFPRAFQKIKDLVVLFQQFLEYKNILCYRNKEILVHLGMLSGTNATTEQYEEAYGNVSNATFHSSGMEVCSLEEQLDQVR